MGSKACMRGKTQLTSFTFAALMLNKLFVRVGFQWAVRSAGFVLVTCLIFGCLATRPRLPPRRDGRLIAVEFHHLRDPGYALITAAAILIIMGMYTPIFYLSTYAVAHGIDPQFAFYLWVAVCRPTARLADCVLYVASRFSMPLLHSDGCCLMSTQIKSDLKSG